MKGDFSRDSFDFAKHFSRVLQQQGRVQLDADWNEQAAILLHYLRTLAADLIGPFAGPADAKGVPTGFAISLTEGEAKDVAIGAGRYYVDGILCENDGTNITYHNQGDFPSPPALPTRSYLVYLDVWERHITAVEDDSIREKALGGPDTTTRTQVVWQVKVDDGATEQGDFMQLPDKPLDEARWKPWIERWQPPHHGCLSVRVKPSAVSTDPCLMAPESRYRGQENQLYRVEIHDGGEAGDATFKWSRDNGSIVTRIVEGAADHWVVENTREFSAGISVEFTNDGQELRGEPGVLVKLIAADGDELTVNASVQRPAGLPDAEKWPTKLRRWDHKEQGALKLTEGASGGEWLDLENGIQIRFSPAPIQTAAHRYRTGDYWLIPARVAGGGIEWPTRTVNATVQPIPQPPHGIRHHFAPLATVIPDGNKLIDLRCGFRALNGCGMKSHGEEGLGGHFSCDPGSSSDA